MLSTVPFVIVLTFLGQLSADQDNGSLISETHSTMHNQKIIPPKFELIGSRYFYIELSSPETWDKSAEICRGMGGYLAAFKTQEEIAAITPKLYYIVWFWTGIKHSKEDGKFISTASGKPATVFKWREGEPSNSGDCVYLGDLGMGVFNCSDTSYFICQSDNET
ncbi:C-type lectin 37Db-like [Drosophila takahashii]|uniref:C-type lectin 37Db-like n=1 Tax=Drosophila takahashii TaxID=29030 RepID=UPI001CF852D8|nr:accessory gland protein Acp29AB-like [Drosophila takahashii]